MLYLPNFGRMTTSTILFEPHKKSVGDVMDIYYDVKNIFQNKVSLRGSEEELKLLSR